MLSKKTAKEIASRHGTPIYVYEKRVVVDKCRTLKKNFPGFDIHYAMKANGNESILRTIRREGVGVEAVSIGEIRQALRAGYKKADISFTCSSLTEAELVSAARLAGRVHLDSLTQLEAWGRLGLGKTVSLRLNQGIGGGHHKHVVTGGPDSKFGISLEDVPAAKRIAKRYGFLITGLQQHIGSNVLDAGLFLKAAALLLKTAEGFADVTHIDFGGGLGVPYRPEDGELDLKSLGKELKILTNAFQKKKGASVSFAMEPGRFLVAEAGTLLVRVTDIKKTTSHTFVGVNSGFNHLIRPAMYGSYHPIVNMSRAGKEATVTIAGNICESGDLFAVKRRMAMPRIGDVLAIGLAGAYGYTMASRYNFRELPKEVVTG